jgi:hypothetical protein
MSLPDITSSGPVFIEFVPSVFSMPFISCIGLGEGVAAGMGMFVFISGVGDGNGAGMFMPGMSAIILGEGDGDGLGDCDLSSFTGRWPLCRAGATTPVSTSRVPIAIVLP